MIVKSFIKYPGGKSRLVGRILGKLPKSDKFFDVFCGGGSIALAYAQKYPDSTIYMNDLDPFTCAIWEIIVRGSDDEINELNKKLEQTPTIELFNFNRGYVDAFRAGKIQNRVIMAYVGIFFHKCTFSGLFDGHPIGGYGQESVWKVGCHYTSKNIIKKVDASRNLLKDRTIVTNLDFRDVNISNGSVAYFDPPYVKKGNALYAIPFSDELHHALSVYIKNLDGVRWLLSYNDDPLVRELYSGYEIEGENHNISMSSFTGGKKFYDTNKGERKKCKKKTELLIFPSNK